MNFTQDWFTNNIPNFRLCMEVVGEQRKEFLEIGAYEGRSTCWLIDNLQDGGTIFSIDPFPNMPDVEQRFHDNVRVAVKDTKIVPCHIKSKSYQALASLIKQEQEFDFVYVDGDHAPNVTLTDAAMAWGLLRSGGVMLFDDYEYPHEPTKLGIDAFLSAFDGQFDMVLKNYQLAVRKK
jgi:predicted O-methyltransferase YrrM